jgi:DNA-nicking Smr family endonuclease
MSRKKWHFRIFCHATKENEISHKNIPSVVEEYLEQCIQAGLSEVRIIHGRGVGVQRNFVRSLLEKQERVVSFQDAPPQAGGWGAILVVLRRAD